MGRDLEAITRNWWWLVPLGCWCLPGQQITSSSACVSRNQQSSISGHGGHWRPPHMSSHRQERDPATASQWLILLRLFRWIIWCRYLLLCISHNRTLAVLLWDIGSLVSPILCETFSKIKSRFTNCLRSYWNLTFPTGHHTSLRVLNPALGQRICDVKTA